MASAKDIYEAKVFAANIYAAGVFRGVGVTVDLTEGPYCSAAHVYHQPGSRFSAFHEPGSDAGANHQPGSRDGTYC